MKKNKATHNLYLPHFRFSDSLVWGDKENKLLSDLYEYMLCPVSLIAQVFQCEEDQIIHRLKDISIYSGDDNDDIPINLPNNGSS